MLVIDMKIKTTISDSGTEQHIVLERDASVYDVLHSMELLKDKLVTAITTYAGDAVTAKGAKLSSKEGGEIIRNVKMSQIRII